MADGQKTEYVNINGIPKSFVHERTTDKFGEPRTFYSVGVQVPYDFSRNGIAEVTTNKVFDCKSDASKVNIGFPKDKPVTVEIYKFYDKEDPEKNEKNRDKTKITPDKLLSLHISYLKDAKERKAAKEAEKEDDGLDR